MGIRPDTDLASAAGLAVDDGNVVDAGLRTTGASIHAAGDVARLPSPLLDASLRVEHEDAAIRTGSAAGLAMTGVSTDYRREPGGRERREGSVPAGVHPRPGQRSGSRCRVLGDPRKDPGGAGSHHRARPLQASDLRGRLSARAYRDPRRRNVFEGTDMAAPSPERAAASPVNGA
jgi:hypothetical protein